MDGSLGPGPGEKPPCLPTRGRSLPGGEGDLVWQWKLEALVGHRAPGGPPRLTCPGMEIPDLIKRAYPAMD